MTTTTQVPAHGRGATQRRTRHVSAGRVIGVGFVCFSVWLLLDARQLYNSAVASPLGTRRSVAVSILRPIARVEEGLGLDRLVNGANLALGHAGTPGGSVSGVGTAPNQSATASTLGGTSRPSRNPHNGAAPSTKTSKASHPKPVGLAKPTIAHPLTVLDVGDSIGEDLGLGLTDALGHDRAIHLITASVGDTGLANLAYYNWPAQFRVELAKDHPGVVLAMFGGNDEQPFQIGNTIYTVGTPAWRRAYGARVAEMMSEATAAGARVVWVGLPIMGPSSGLTNSGAEALNAIYASQATQHPGVTYFSCWKLFENAKGQYSTYLTNAQGGLVQVRDPDETHIDPPGGTDLLANAVVARMKQLYHVAF